MSGRDLWLTTVTLLIPVAACAQTIDRGSGTVQFHFAARTGVCGDGQNFWRSSGMGYYTNTGDGVDGSCVAGPVRVVIVRDGGETLRIETYVGPLLPGPDDGRDLGAIPAKDAANELLHLAATLDGRPAREAITPAMLADSAVVTPQLVAIAGDGSRSRDVRSSALGWLSRRRDEVGGVGDAAVTNVLQRTILDPDEAMTLRRQALSAVANLDRGAGVPLLESLTRDTDTWVSAEAFSSLARSGDPRARQFVRAAFGQSDLRDDFRRAAITGLADEYASANDYRLLRDFYPQADNDQQRTLVISALGNAGGTDNVNWLLQLARSPTESAARRRQAVVSLRQDDSQRVRDALKDLVDIR